MSDFIEPDPELRRRTLNAGQARVAVLRRTYRAPVADVWDACTDPERLARWYVPVSGEFTVGGHIQQARMGSGTIVTCRPPELLVLSLGPGGADEIRLQLTPVDADTTELELQHATTAVTHEVGGEVYDAIFCMGGGYYPRLLALHMHLSGTLPPAYDALHMHLDASMRPAIDRGSAAMAALLASPAPNAGP